MLINLQLINDYDIVNMRNEEKKMFKAQLKLISIVSIPVIIFLIIGINYSLQKWDVQDTADVSGTISSFYGGSNQKYLKKPMHIIINNEKYIIIHGIRWAKDHDALVAALVPGNDIKLTYFEKNDEKFVISINYDNKTFVSYEETKMNQELYWNNMASLYFCLAYTYEIIVLLICLLSQKTLDMNYNTGFCNKIYLFKKQRILEILFIIILLILALVFGILISKWIYLSLLTIAMIIIYYFHSPHNIIYFGKGGFRIKLTHKTMNFGWNALKQVIIIQKKYQNKVILNFKEEVSYDGSVANYLKLVKDDYLKNVFCLSLNNLEKKEFVKLSNKYFPRNNYK